MADAVQDTLDIREQDEWPEPKTIFIPARDLKPHRFRPNAKLYGLYCTCNLPRGNPIHQE